MKPPVSQCKRVVIPTNHDRLFLLEETPTNLVVNRSLSTAEISPSSFVSVRDDFLFLHTLELLEKEFRSVLTTDCQARRREERTQHYLRHTVAPGLTTWNSGTTFSLGSGEVVYDFLCTPLRVRMVNQQGLCYEFPQVERIDEPPEGVEDVFRGKPLFLVPMTRQLTSIAKTTQCSDTFLAKYENIYGEWFSVYPRLRSSKPPLIPANATSTPILWEDKADFSKTGLYSKEELRALESQQTNGLNTEAWSQRLANQGGTLPQGDKGYVYPEDLFPHMPDPKEMGTKIYKAMVDFLHMWGYTASIFVSIFMLWKTLVTLINWIISFVVLRDSHGCGRHLFWIPCPKFMLLAQYRGEGRRHRRWTPGAPVSHNRTLEERLDSDSVVSMPPGLPMQPLSSFRPRAPPRPPPPAARSTPTSILRTRSQSEPPSRGGQSTFDLSGQRMRGVTTENVGPALALVEGALQALYRQERKTTGQTVENDYIEPNPVRASQLPPHSARHSRSQSVVIPKVYPVIQDSANETTFTIPKRQAPPRPGGGPAPSCPSGPPSASVSRASSATSIATQASSTASTNRSRTRSGGKATFRVPSRTRARTPSRGRPRSRSCSRSHPGVSTSRSRSRSRSRLARTRAQTPGPQNRTPKE